METSTIALSVNGIEVIYNHVILVLKGVSLKVPDGRIVALLGGNGAGKTTTLRAISNLLAGERGQVTKGSIEYRGVRVEISPGQLKINAHNPEQEEAQEEVEADTKVDSLVIGFNVNYLLDALSALRDEHVVLQLRDANSSALVREAGSDKCRHVVMPLRL